MLSFSSSPTKIAKNGQNQEMIIKMKFYNENKFLKISPPQNHQIFGTNNQSIERDLLDAEFIWKSLLLFSGRFGGKS